MIEDYDELFAKCKEVKKEIKENNYKFSIEHDVLPDVPEVATEELIEFMAENFRFLCLSDQRDLLAYLMFIFDTESFESLVGELTSMGDILIDEIIAVC